MKKIMCIAAAILCGMATNISCHAESNDKIAEVQYPRVIRENDIGSISSERSASVLDLIYSPDGKYLAIVFGEAFKGNSLVIWDVEKNKIKSKVSDLDTSMYGGTGSPLIWSMKDKYITFGSASKERPMRLYDPMTGALIKEVPIIIDGASLSNDGAKLISLKGSFGHQAIVVYDMTNWTAREYSVGPLYAQMICWIADNKILVGGVWTRASIGQYVDGVMPKQSDVVLQVIDPVTGNGLRSRIIPSVPSASGINGFEQSVGLLERYVVSQDGGRIAFGAGLIADTSTLNVVKYGSDEEVRRLKLTFSDVVLSADGKYAFLLQGIYEKSKNSLVLDAGTGKVLANFDAHGNHIAISPDNRHLAVGGGAKLTIYSVLMGEKP